MNAKGFSLRYRKDKRRWVLAFPPPDGGRKWIERVAPPEIQRAADANAWAAGLLSQRALSGPVVAKHTRRIDGDTVRSLYDGWSLAIDKRVAAQKIEPATAGGYRTAFNAWILPMLGDEPANALDIPKLREWIGDLCEKKAKRGGKTVVDAKDGRTLSPMRVANTFSALSVFLSDMIADKKVRFTSNPCLDEAVRRELPDRPRPGQARIAGARPGVPTVVDVQAAVDASAMDDFRLRCCIGFGQGFRDGEISGLRIRSLVLDAAVPHFSISEAVKLRGPTGFATPGKLKTTSSERVVPMHPANVDGLREWLGDGGGWQRLMRREPRPDDFVLPGSTGGPTRPKSSKQFRAALVAAGRPIERGGKPITFRSTRNAFATALAEAGVPREVRKLLMGHTADDVDEAHYTAHALGKLAEYVARIPLVWNARPSARPVVRPAAEHDGATT